MFFWRIFGFCAALCLPLVAAADPASLVGRWQYIQTPDEEGEILDLWESGGRYRGIMNGLERAGEHGVFYFVVEVQDLSISSEGAIHFIVGERSFFASRPPLSELVASGDSGYARDTMRFDGRLDDTELVLKCFDSAGSCPAETMRFKRISKMPD